MKEKINKMKLCLLCRDSDEYPYTELNAELHEKFNLHFTLGKTWAPLKGHKDYDTHQRTTS